MSESAADHPSLTTPWPASGWMPCAASPISATRGRTYRPAGVVVGAKVGGAWRKHAGLEGCAAARQSWGDHGERAGSIAG